MALQTNAYPLCCGAGIMTGFTTINTPAEFEVEVDEALCRAKRDHRWGMLHAITNQNQTRAAAVLEKMGWSKGMVVTNPVHQDETVITQWTFNLHEYKPKKKAVEYKNILPHLQRLNPPATYKAPASTKEVAPKMAPANPTVFSSSTVAGTLKVLNSPTTSRTKKRSASATTSTGGRVRDSKGRFAFKGVVT